MMSYQTECIGISPTAIERAATFLLSGDVVAFPTETVYGLGANALSEDAVRRIFEAKGRPADNPLIVHIASRDDIAPLVRAVPEAAEKLMDAFFPGPLTLIMPRSDTVPNIVSAGLSTVAVRMPAHPVAQALIRAAGVPIAAPSANRSGKPSPTTAQHVLEDLAGRIPLILDGGSCTVGLESTVVDVSGDGAVLLRPGGVTVEMLRDVFPELSVDEGVLAPIASGTKARSPGMLHRHYAPEARVVLVEGRKEARAARIAALYDATVLRGEQACVLCETGNVSLYGTRDVRALGHDGDAMAAQLFDALRALDHDGIALALVEAPQTQGMGLALMNRLLRAADFELVHAD